MRKMMAIAAAVLVLVVALVVGIGHALPVAHVAARTTTLPQPPARVFAAVTDVEAFPRWRRGVAEVQVLARHPGAALARNRQRRHHVRAGGTGATAPAGHRDRRSVAAVRRHVDVRADPDPAGTRLTITERGEVFNPVFRFMSRFVFGHTATVDAFLEDLRGHLGG